MKFSMYLNVAMCTESFSRLFTSVEFFSTMNPQMLQKPFTVTEGFPTYLIFIEILCIFLILTGFVSSLNYDDHIRDK
jgi:hypothetical protein